MKRKGKENPFYRWLGIQSSRPHYYKLLGVPRNANVKQIERAANARVAQLEAADPGEDAAGLKRVSEAIEKARAVLCDPERRQKYDQKLAAAIEKKSKTSGKLSSESAKAERPYTQDDLLPPGATPGSGRAQKDPGPETVPGGTVSQESAAAVAQPVEVKPDGDIPMAVPLTASGAAPPRSDRSNRQGTPTGDDTAWREAEDNDPISGSKSKGALSGKFRIRSRGGRRRKRSLMLPLLSMFFFVVGIAGLLYFLFAYLEMNGGAPMTAGGSNGAVVGGDATDTGDQTGLTEGPPPDSDPEVNAGQPEDPDNEVPDDEDPDDEDPEMPDDPDMESPDQGDPDQGDSDQGDSDQGDSDQGDSDQGDSDQGDSEMPDDPDMKRPEPRSLTFGQQVQFRRLIQRADRNLYQRNLELASEAVQQAAALLEGGEGAGQLDEQGEDLLELALGMEKMADNVEGFWQQVVKSGRENDGDIPIGDSGDRFVTVVESVDDYITLRSAGVNLTYRYREMPAGLAMDLADSGEKEDVPTWNIQKATFYAVNRRVDLKYGDLALEFIQAAEQDGHDLGYLRDYLRVDLSGIGRPTAPVRAVDPSRWRGQLRELKKTWEIPSRIGSLSSDECDTFNRQLAAEMDQLADDENLQRAATSELIRQLAIQAGNVDLALESVAEQAFWVKLDTTELTVETLSELAGGQLDRDNARLCIDSYLRFRQRGQNDVAAGSKIRKLHQQVEALAKEAGFRNLLRQLERLQSQ